MTPSQWALAIMLLITGMTLISAGVALDNTGLAACGGALTASAAWCFIIGQTYRH